MSDKEEKSIVSDDNDDKQGEVQWNDLKEVQHIHTVNEFARQMFGRINSQGFDSRQLSESC